LTAGPGMYPWDPGINVRASALGTIARARGKDAVAMLVDATGSDQPRPIRQTAANLLGGGGAANRDPRGEDALERLTAPVEDRGIRMTALNALAASGDSARATAVALRAMGDPDPLFAAAAAGLVGRVGGTAGKPTLAEALKKETRVTVRAAMTRVLQGGGGGR